MKKVYGLYIFIIFSVFLLIISGTEFLNEILSAQERARTLYFQAGKQETKIDDDGVFIKSYYGDVRAVTDDGLTEIHSDAARYNSAEKEGRFYGHVSFRDSTRTLNADTLVFSEVNNEVRAIGNVIGSEADRIFWADHVGYNRNTRIVRATGGVVVRDDSLKSSVHGATAVFNDSTGNGFIFGKPVLVREDEKGTIITLASEDTIDVDKQRRLITIWKGVSMVKDSLKAYCGKAVYDDSLETAILTDNPRVYHTMIDKSEGQTLTAQSILTGDTIKVFLRERKVSGADIISKSKGITVWTDSIGSLSARSVIESGNMSLYMEKDMITGLYAVDNAKSYYYREPTDTDKLYLNQAAGDTIHFFFDNGRMERVIIEGRRGSDAAGKYYEYSPEKKQTDEAENIENAPKK